MLRQGDKWCVHRLWCQTDLGWVLALSLTRCRPWEMWIFMPTLQSLKRIRENICKIPNIGPKTWETLSFYCMYTDQKFLLRVIYFKIIYMYIYDFLVDYIGSLTSGIY